MTGCAGDFILTVPISSLAFLRSCFSVAVFDVMHSFDFKITLLVGAFLKANKVVSKVGIERICATSVETERQGLKLNRNVMTGCLGPFDLICLATILSVSFLLRLC